MFNTIITPERLPIFEWKEWRLVSHTVNRGQDYMPAYDYDHWLVDVVKVDGTCWFQQALEVRHYGDAHFEIHAGPYFVLLSQHLGHQPDAVFDDLFETAYLAAIEAQTT